MLGNTESASECFGTWAAIDEQTPEFFFAYAQLALIAKDLGEAEIGMLAACELQPTSAKYHAAISTLFARADAKDKALEKAREAVQVDPDCIHGWLALAAVDPTDARAALAKAVELRRNFVDLSHLGLIITEENP
jgi:tetratricopeptide (TPR) repeat protein